MVPHAADAQLWAAVRRLSTTELLSVQQRIRAFHRAASETPLDAKESAVALQLGGRTQSVRVDDFVRVFVAYLHSQGQLHAAARVAEDAPTSETPKEINVATFEDEFPQLKPTKPSVKRRITTTLLTHMDATLVARPVPAAVAFPPLGVAEGTRPPAWAKRSLLEKRMGAAAPAPSAWGEKTEKTSVWGKQKAAATIPVAVGDKKAAVIQVKPKKKETQHLVVKKELSNQVTHLQEEAVKLKRKDTLPSNQEEHQEPTAVKMASSSDFAVNKQAAKLYGFLIRERFVKSTCAELQVLISLLYRADCTSCRSGDAQTETPTTDKVEASCGAASEFCWRTHCLDFAEIVFLEIEPVLAHLGADLLGLVTHSLRDAEGICVDMLDRLEDVSRRRDGLRVAESARIGCQLPVEMKASAVRDFALPFNEETDSRLHYRTTAEAQLYTNREKVRDGFLSLLRQFQQKQHSLVGIENAGVAAAAIAAARDLLAEVSPENRWWFAKFFVMELVQVGSNPFGESDNDLVLKIMEDKLVEKNPDRLRKLHRRFSSQNKAPQPQVHSGGGRSNGSNNNQNRLGGKGSNSNPVRKNRQDHRAPSTEDDATKKFTATLDRMRSFFTDNQLFFFHFLHSCDSYEFSELVKHQLERQFYSIREATSPSADPRKDFTEVVLKLKVVAKFLGYLRFSPQWQVTSSIRGYSAQNAAFKAVEREGISTLEVARDSSLDVKKLLEGSILHASISKCIPWLCDYLSMLSLDRLSSGTTYFKQLVVLLQLLYRSPRLNSLGETGLYIAMQIERIFHVLHVDGSFLHDAEYQSKDLLPASQIRDALARQDEASPEEPETGSGEDRLPFLYSQVFVQSCVSELDDLRGFIQTRAQPTPRRKLSIGSGSASAGQPVAPIRKLRPLQVVIEDDPTAIETFSSFTAKHDNAVHAAAPGAKLSTTRFASNFPAVREENDNLSEAIFKIHPKLKPVVEFVVGTATTDVCEYVMAQVVTPRADLLVDRCASESGLFLSGGASSDADDAASVARASFQMLLSSKTRHKVHYAVAAALEEALRLGEERVSAAVPPFMPPSSHPTLINSIVSVALQRTRGALKTLVPKSCQTEFVNRVAFRNKCLLKDLGSASKVAAAALSSPAQLAAVTNKGERTPCQEELRSRELRRCSAAISKSANLHTSTNRSLVEWERRATTLLECLPQFTDSLRECVASGDSTRDAASPLSVSSLMLWDVIWRVVTSSLKFLGTSLEVFAACEVLSMKEERVETVEKLFAEFAAHFSKLLEVIVRSVGNVHDNSAISRVQRVLAVVVDCMLNLPPTLASGPEHADLVKRFAVPTYSQVATSLQAAASSSGAAIKLLELNLDRLIDEPRDSPVESASPRQAQFRRDVLDAVASRVSTPAK